MDRSLVIITTSDQSIDYAKWGNVTLRSMMRHITLPCDFRWYTSNPDTVPCYTDGVEIVQLPEHDVSGLDDDQEFSLKAFSTCPDGVFHAVAEGKYDRVIYADIDVVAVGNLDSLLTMDISRSAVYGSFDYQRRLGLPNWHYHHNKEPAEKISDYMLGLIENWETQFNAGFFVVNAKRMRDLHLPDFRKWCDVFYKRYHDQEFWNVHLQGEMTDIGPEYNWRSVNNVEFDSIDELNHHLKRLNEPKRVVQYVGDQKTLDVSFEALKEKIDKGVDLIQLGSIVTSDIGHLIEYVSADPRLYSKYLNADHIRYLIDIISMRNDYLSKEKHENV